MPAILSHFEIALRLFSAAVLGGIIGFERERLSRFAGLRTHMLVCIGAALIMIVSQYGFHEVLTNQLVILDPSRVAAQVVSGIGFLGAGTILFRKNVVHGLTTAATLWTVAGIGLSTGAGLYFPSIVVTIIVLLVLAGIRPIERKFFKKEHVAGEIKFVIKSGKFSISSLKETLEKQKKQFRVLNIQIESENEKEIVLLSFESSSQEILLSVIDSIRTLSGVQSIEHIDESDSS